jgi:hypothetical protein
MVTNAVMALSFSLCGLALAARRPGNPIGWLFLADGLGHAITAAAVPLITVGLTAHWSIWVVRAISTAGAYSWPWSIGLFLPLALLLFPDGRAPGRQWRWLLWAAIATAPLFVVDAGSEPSGIMAGGPSGYLTISDHDRLTVVWAVAELRVVLLYGASVLALALRYRRGSERERRQLLWPMLAVLIAVGVLVPWSLFAAGPVLMLLAIPLIGGAVTIAILRHQLLDIRLVFSRTVLYLLLAGGVVLSYVILVTMLELMLRRQVGLGASVLVTVLVAAGFNPVRVRLQRLMDRAMYGGEAAIHIGFHDPVRPTLTRFGLSPEVTREAERYKFRYRIRLLGVLLMVGVAANSAIVGGLLRFGYFQLVDDQVRSLAIYAVTSSVLVVLLTSPLLQFLARRNRSTYTIHLLFRTIATLTWLETLRQLDGGIRHRQRIYRNLRIARQELQSNSWMLSGNLAVLSGRRTSDRDWPPVAALGRWLCWVSEDLHDTSRIDGAIQACVDTMRHLLGSAPFGPPSLQDPPRQATMTRPSSLERLSRYSLGMRAVLITLIPIIAASVGFIVRLMP